MISGGSIFSLDGKSTGKLAFDRKTLIRSCGRCWEPMSSTSRSGTASIRSNVAAWRDLSMAACFLRAIAPIWSRPLALEAATGASPTSTILAWKLDLVLRGEASLEILESYNDEAVATADENILHSTRATDFLTPKSRTSEIFRDSVLELAREAGFARRFVNSGRLSTAVSYPESALNTPDRDDWCGDGVSPGSPPLDAPMGDDWLLGKLGGEFVLLSNGPAPVGIGLKVVDLAEWDRSEDAVRRYGLEGGGAYLMRPDQYVAARWKTPNAGGVRAALARARGAAA